MTDTSRRDFLTRTTRVAVGTGVLSLARTNEAIASALAAPLTRAAARPSLLADEPLLIGVIGTGGMGTGHVESFAAIGKDGRAAVRVAALADVCRPRLDAARQKLETIQGVGTVETYYADYRALLARKDLHGVVVASPEHWHARMAEDAVAAGKAVYLEKPMTLRLPEALRLLQVVRSNPQALINVGTQFVTMPSYQKARELVKAGAIEIGRAHV